MEKEISEQLITFKTAKLAKEKGFEPETLQNQILSAFDKNGKNTGWTTKFFYCWQSTQSILHRWLRERHQIDLIVPPSGDKDGKTVGYYYEIIRDFSSENIISKDFLSYEDAMEEGLFEALKLIKL